MKPLYDLNSYDPAYSGVILQSLIGKMESTFLQVFKPVDFNQMAGKVPYVSRKGTLGNVQHVKIAIDGEPQGTSSELTGVDVRYDHKYAKAAQLSAIVAEGYGNITNSDLLVEHLLGKCMVDVAAAIDLEGRALLLDPAVNTVRAATSQWAGPTGLPNASATPILDLEAAADAVGAPNIGWFGLPQARALARADGFKGTFANYATSEGGVSLSSLAQMLKDHLGLQDVIIDGTWYNAANEAKAISQSRIFDGIAWLGYREHVVVVEHPTYRDSGTKYIAKRQVYEAWCSIMVDMKRAEREAGVSITGTIA